MRLLLVAAFAATACTTSALATDEAAVLDFLRAEFNPPQGTSANIAFTDLNADGNEEAVIYMSGPNWCGSGGCDSLVLTPEGDTFRVVMDTTVSWTPMGMLESASNGWRDLTITVGGGGGEAGIAVMKFDGTSYPRNPTTQPMVEDIGEVLIGESDESTLLDAAQ